jgi:hypothetical protein
MGIIQNPAIGRNPNTPTATNTTPTTNRSPFGKLLWPQSIVWRIKLANFLLAIPIVESDLRLSRSDVSFEVGCVLDGISLRVVVEIGEYIQSFGQAFLDLRRPGGEQLMRVASAIAVAVEPQVNPIGRDSPRVIVDHVVNAQSGIVAMQDCEHLFAEPAGISKLDRPAMIFGSGFQECSEPLWIRFPVGWKLHQNRSQEIPEPIGALKKPSDRVSWLFEPHDVRAIAAELERVTKPFGSPCRRQASKVEGSGRR